jgi:hypothetical protein
MSHILKEYSKNLEVDPSRPIVNKHYYPVTPEKYIVIYNEQSIDSKCYRYYSLAIDLIKPELHKLGIKVVLIGSGKDITDRADFIYPNLNFRKNAYIVSKAELLISVDNAIAQFASHEDVPVVGLYGNVYSSVTTPYWLSKKRKVDLEPKWKVKPSLSLSDPEDSINNIPAERIAESVFKLLKPGSNLKINFKTKLKNKHKDFEIDVIPTKYVPAPVFENSVLNLRLDRAEINQEAFYTYCSNHKCNILIEDAVLKPETIDPFHYNVNSIQLTLTKDIGDIPKEYFVYFKKRNIDFKIVVKNKDILDETRFKYFDQKVEFNCPIQQKPQNVSDGDRFFSFKLVVDGGKIYKSTYHWKNNIDNGDNIVDNADYWEELDYFYIYEQDRNQ